jgi:hypothetical protein
MVTENGTNMMHSMVPMVHPIANGGHHLVQMAQWQTSSMVI